MANASARYSAALPAVLSLCLVCSGVSASDRIETVAAVTIVGSAGITVTNNVINNAPLQALLLTAAIAPTTVVFTATGAGPVSVSGTGAGPTTVSGTSGGANLSSDDGGGPSIVAFGGGSPGGTVIDGDAVSVNVDSVSGGSAPGNARVTVVIAQYN